jgi:uncharacterized membrane protein
LSAKLLPLDSGMFMTLNFNASAMIAAAVPLVCQSRIYVGARTANVAFGGGAYGKFNHRAILPLFGRSCGMQIDSHGLEARAQKLRRRTFVFLVVLKGLDGLLDLAGAAALALVSNSAIREFVAFATRRELTEDPRDFIANALVQWAANFGQDAKSFVVLYLLFHGVAKTVLAVSLVKGAPWAYPLAIWFFGTFVVYAVYRQTLHFSTPLAIFILFDLLTIGIIAREWGQRARGSIH